MESTAPKILRLRLWFTSRSGIVKGLLLGFFIPLILSVIVGLLGLLLGTRMEADLGSRIITVALLSVDLPGVLFLTNFITILPGGDESLAMGFLLLATLPSCVFWGVDWYYDQLDDTDVENMTPSNELLEPTPVGTRVICSPAEASRLRLWRVAELLS